MRAEYTERVKRIFNMAKEEAVKFNNTSLTPEHVLLAIIEEGEGMACEVLKRLGIELEGLRTSLIDVLVNRKEFEYSTYSGRISSMNIRFSASLQKVLQLSFEEARMMHQSYVGTEHILLGIILEKNNDASKILSMWGIDVEMVRYEIMNITKNKDMRNDKKIPYSQSSGKVSILSIFSRDLTLLARKNKLDPVIGREKEMERIIEILARRKKNNPVLLGEAGVGKTAIVEGLAQKIVKREVPQQLYNKRIVSIDMSAIVAGTKYRGQFEERLRTLISEVKEDENIILFIDEIHTIVGAGAGEGALDASNILKPVLTRGEVQIIGSSTYNDYRRYIERNPALERRFQPVFIEPPTPEETIRILKGLREIYEDFHQVKYPDETLEKAVRLAERYITDRQFPDKALDIIDEAGARVKLYRTNKNPELEEIENRIKEYTEEKVKAIELQEYEKAGYYRDEIMRLEKERERILRELEKRKRENYETVSPEDISYVVSMWTGIPLSKLEETERERLLKIEEALKQRIVAQDHAIELVARAIRRSRAGVKDPRRPTGVFMFLGPTGVGKTELARTLAIHLFGSEDALIRIDMSEYMERFNVSKLIGAPPGYVGYEEGGQLTEQVKRKPYSVVLFDEIEKAHPEVFNILLQIMEDGQLTDSFGRKINFRNTIIIMTSNVATGMLGKSVKLGFEKDSGVMDYEVIKEKVMSEIKKFYRPEFLNRLDEIIVFKPLDRESMKKIVEIMLKDVRERLKEQGIEIDFNEDIKELLIEEGFDPEYGARPLRRAIRRILEEPLSEEILKKDMKKGSRINTIRKGKKLCFITE